VDTDEALAVEAGVSVAELVDREGEPALRAREQRLIARLGILPQVVSVGGGLFTIEQARQLLKERALLVGLHASLPVLLSRLAESPTRRPLLEPAPAERLPQLLGKREAAYSDVHVRLRVDGLTAPQAAESICLLYQQLFPALHPEAAGVRSTAESESQSVARPDSFRQTFGVSEVLYTNGLPSPESLASGGLLIHDQVLSVVGEGVLAPWLARFPLRYSVTAGESLKDLTAFPQHVRALLELATPLAASRLSVIAAGGGTVGDFAGFFASVFKRGVSLTQVPTTWLAALDSAHGGKNALNVGQMKNQIGTIVPAQRIVMSRALLTLQPKERTLEAFGELAKMAIIDGGQWVQALLSSSLQGSELLWRFLPDAVAAKYRVVEADPLERLGVRHQLNLGHTVGHVLETVHRLPHGLAVAQGLYFALDFSTEIGLLSESERAALQAMLIDRFGIHDRRSALPKIPQKQFVALLRQDKKRAEHESVRFVVVRGLGRVTTTEVTLSALLQFAIELEYVLPA
jgi:3-dehydroquinate synthase